MSVSIVVLGVGAIGREFLRQINPAIANGKARIRVCGLLDSTGYVFERAGVRSSTLRALCAQKRRGSPLRQSDVGRPANPLDALAFIAAQLPDDSILVDATAADTREMLDLVLERGWDVVLANKVPIAGEQACDDALRGLAERSGARILQEATVGAGLPVMDTVRKLIEAGDRIHSIEGCPSGTLGFVFGELGRGRPFSEAVREAMCAGYTEPDPRIDLSGLDVARKALILARAIGYRGDLGDIHAEDLVPPTLRRVPLGEFLERLPELDAAWRSRAQRASARGVVLRYRARVTPGRVRVGLEEVSLSSPMGQLQGTDNQFAFTSVR